MSQENVEIIRAAYAAMSARDLRRVSELARPDVEWIPDHRVGEGPIHGREKSDRVLHRSGLGVRRA